MNAAKGKPMFRFVGIFVLSVLLLSCFTVAAYAGSTFNYGTLHARTYTYGNQITYNWRNGYGYDSTFPIQKATTKSWMWVKNVSRDVGNKAIFSQAGQTYTDLWSLDKTTCYGPGIWSSGTNYAGQAVESYLEETLTYGHSAVAWGNGFVRTPYSEYEHTGTEENFILSVPE